MCCSNSYSCSFVEFKKPISNILLCFVMKSYQGSTYGHRSLRKKNEITLELQKHMTMHHGGVPILDASSILWAPTVLVVCNICGLNHREQVPLHWHSAVHCSPVEAHVHLLEHLGSALQPHFTNCLQLW